MPRVAGCLHQLPEYQNSSDGTPIKCRTVYSKWALPSNRLHFIETRIKDHANKNKPSVTHIPKKEHDIARKSLSDICDEHERA